METLYNGITLPSIWPPEKLQFHLDEQQRILPDTPPYLLNPPELIPTAGGRQLFVDDFLVEERTLHHHYHRPVRHPGNPILKPERPWECQGRACAVPKSGGICFDAKEGLWKMWYEAGWLQSIAYAISTDGIHWERPSLDILPGTNLVLPRTQYLSCQEFHGVNYLRPDSTSVWIDDDDPDTSQRYKMFLRNPGGDFPGITLTSADGIHWGNPRPTSVCGDRSTIFYNPFRKKWCCSIRTSWLSSAALGLPNHPAGLTWERSRSYHEDSDFFAATQWGDAYQKKWLCADSLDIPDTLPECHGFIPQLYNVDVVRYESIMLGMAQILKGPENNYGEKTGHPKFTDIMPMYSRDGYHFSRPCREEFISSTRQQGDWDFGYVQSVTGFCHNVGDETRIYYAGFSGDATKPQGADWTDTGMYHGGALGMATLRRDGFVSLQADSAGGNVLTRILTSPEGGKITMNVNGAFQVEVLTPEGEVQAASTMTTVDSTAFAPTLTTPDGRTFEGLAPNTPFRLRITLAKGDLYAFQIAP